MELDEGPWSSADSGLPADSSKDKPENIPMVYIKQESHKRSSSITTVSSLNSYADLTQRGRVESIGTDISSDSVFESRDRTKSFGTETSFGSEFGNETENTLTTGIDTKSDSSSNTNKKTNMKKSKRKTSEYFSPREELMLNAEVQDLIDDIDSSIDGGVKYEQQGSNKKKEDASNSQSHRKANVHDLSIEKEVYRDKHNHPNEAEMSRGKYRVSM